VRRLLGFFIATALSVGSTAGSLAQADRFPVRPLQMILTSTPGSQSDVLTRFLATEAAKTLGQPIVVVNKANSTGTIGATLAKHSAPDGYTLFLGGNTTMAANVHLVKNIPYDPLQDFEPVTLATANPLVLVVRVDLPVKSLAEFVTYAKSRPGQLNYGVGNSGNKVAQGLLESLTGIRATEVGFAGASQPVLELVAGRLDFIFSDPLVADPFIREGRIRALAVTSATKPPSLNGLPTMVEAGVPGYGEFTTWFGYYVPRGTPRSVIVALNRAFVQAINSKEGQDQYRRMGLVPRTSTPEALAAFNREQIKVWEHLVKVSGLQPQ
jgi:tripartite-type tricarboxylate transporter receptor subunit TctC